MALTDEPILWLWAFSAWAAKVTAYLALRGIPHSRCEQPITQPRPHLAALGVQYRRIPLMSIGRDMYCDTLLILEKLEQMYPSDGKYKGISATNPTEKALEKLFEKWTDVVVFKYAGACIPTDMDLMKDENFQKDREALWGRSWSKEGLTVRSLVAERLISVVLGLRYEVSVVVNWRAPGSNGVYISDEPSPASCSPQQEVHDNRLVKAPRTRTPTLHHHCRIHHGCLLALVQQLASFATSQIQQTLLLVLNARIFPHPYTLDRVGSVVTPRYELRSSTFVTVATDMKCRSDSPQRFRESLTAALCPVLGFVADS